jgi:hypothetical protein
MHRGAKTCRHTQRGRVGIGAPECDACCCRQLCQQGDIGVRHKVSPQLTDVSRTHVVGRHMIRQHIHCRAATTGVMIN